MVIAAMKRFWKSSQPPPREETISGAVGRLKRVENLILKSQSDILKKIQNCDRQAKAYFQTYPQMARACLKQKQALLQQHAQVTNQLGTIQQQLNSLEMNLVTTEVVKGVQATHSALAATNVQNAPERVTDLMDATAEKMEEAQEVADVVAENAIQTQLDEDIIDKEMAMLFEQSINTPSQITHETPANIESPPKIKPAKNIEQEMLQWAELAE